MPEGTELLAGGLVGGVTPSAPPRNEQDRQAALLEHVAEGVALDAIKRTAGFKQLVRTIVGRIAAERAAIHQLADDAVTAPAGEA